MARNKFLLSALRLSPGLVTGLIFVVLLYGCQTATPQDVTVKFWQDLAQGRLENAKKLTSQDTQAIVTVKDIDKFSPISTGEVVTDENYATVATTITRRNKPITFNTVLLKEQDGWKVDFQQTHTNIAMLPFEGIAKSLQELGDTFANQLEQQIPLIEKEMETLGNQLKGEIDKFGQALKKSIPPAVKPNTPANPKPPGTI